jgi:hypothetical protein
VALAIGLAGAAPVLARRMGLVEAIALLSMVSVYDASAYLVGSGGASRWEGPAAGVAAVAAVTLATAAVFVPPFEGASPWAAGAVVAGLGPLGPLVATALLGRPLARAPALRRLDSLLIVGIPWVAVVGVLT